MKTDKEIVGTLLGFDDFVSILSTFNVFLWLYQPTLLQFMSPHSCRCSQEDTCSHHVSCLICNTNLLLFALLSPYS